MIEDYNHLLERILFQVTGKELEPLNIRTVNGGCINMALSVTTTLGDFFVKWNELEFSDMFEKEAKGLAILSSLNTVAVPDVIGFGVIGEKSFLVLEHLVESYPSNQYWENLGRQLANLHKTKSESCGLAYDNYIGRLFQKNTPIKSWVGFYKEMRLNHQLGLAIYNGYVDMTFVQRFKSFLVKIGDVIPDSEPCLLHGDLWSGNVMSVGSTGYIFDPAVYFGAAEMDLAMTRLFGGFHQQFYDAYNDVNAISDDFENLLDIYQLYPLMVHVNLFGPHSGYLGEVERIIKRYL